MYSFPSSESILLLMAIVLSNLDFGSINAFMGTTVEKCSFEHIFLASLLIYSWIGGLMFEFWVE
jgi:hypothetical protein